MPKSAVVYAYLKLLVVVELADAKLTVEDNEAYSS
jgi:hypothetical protein